MKIGMMADYYGTHISGVTNHISLIKHSLESAGQEVYIFTFGDDEVVDAEKNIIRTAGVSVVDTGFYFNLRYNRHARQLLYSMDIAHVHHPFVSGSLAMRYCVPRNIPIVFTHHTRYDLYTQTYLPILPETIGDAVLKAYLAPFFRACNLIIVPSQSMLTVLKNHFGEYSSVEVIPNGLDLTPYRADIHSIDRSVFGFSNNDVICTYVGRLAPEKNLVFLLHAFHDVSKSNSHVRLLLVGEGPVRKKLESKVKQMGMGSKVFFTGLIPYRDIPHYLASSNIFVSASITEVFPLSTIEAIGAGLPVVGINAPGTRDIIDDGVTGLISPNDLATFTSKLLLLSTDHELRQRLGKQAKEASKKYDIQTTTEILLQQYQRVIDAAKERKKDAPNKETRFIDRFE